RAAACAPPWSRRRRRSSTTWPTSWPRAPLPRQVRMPTCSSATRSCGASSAASAPLAWRTGGAVAATWPSRPPSSTASSASRPTRSSCASSAAASWCGERVILWFAGGSLVLVWSIFRDPAVDYRLVVVGAVLPDAVDGVFGGARVLHSLLFSVVLLAAVMLATRQQRAARRRFLAVPIGTF